MIWQFKSSIRKKDNNRLNTEYHNILLIFTETVNTKVDQINVLINIFGSGEENVEMFDNTEPVKEGMHSNKEYIISIS